MNEVETFAMDKAAEVARLAADVLEDYGWCQGGLMDEEGRACLIESLYLASAKLCQPPWSMSSAPYRAFAEYLGVDRWRISNWNDEPQRTVEQVTKELRGFAELLEATNER